MIERDGGSLGISIAGGSGSVPLKPDDKVLTVTNMYIRFYSLRCLLIVFVHFATENSFLSPPFVKLALISTIVWKYNLLLMTFHISVAIVASFDVST